MLWGLFLREREKKRLMRSNLSISERLCCVFNMIDLVRLIPSIFSCIFMPSLNILSCLFLSPSFLEGFFFFKL